MIQKIGQRIEFKQGKALVSKSTEQKSNNDLAQNPISQKSADAGLLQKYYVSFGAAKNSELEKRQKFLEAVYTSEASEILNTAGEFAKKMGHAEITENHVTLATLAYMKNLIEDIDSGTTTREDNPMAEIPQFFEETTHSNVFKDKKERKKIKPVIEESINEVKQALSEMPRSSDQKIIPKLSEALVNGMFDIEKEACMVEQVESVPFNSTMMLSSMHSKQQKQTVNLFKKFSLKFSGEIMLDRREPKEKVHLKMYDEKARNVLKNLSLGTNMYVTYEQKTNPMFVVDSLVDLLQNQGAEFGKINKKDTKITVFNDNVKDGFFVGTVRDLGKDKAHNHIVVMDMDDVLMNSADINFDAEGNKVKTLKYSAKLSNAIMDAPENVKFVFLQGKNSYYMNMESPMVRKIFENFGEISSPIMTTEQAKKAFREQPLLMNKIDIPFSKTAIDRAVEVSATLDGAYPEKAQKVLKKIASYFVGKKEVTERDVKSYVKEAKDLFRGANDGSSVNIDSDTGVKIKDIIGKNTTKKEAEAIVKEIKSGKLGSRGYVIYSQDGSAGSGRKFTAKAIAGETKSPYVEIDALDFGTKDVSIFGGNALTPEASIQKLFSLLNTQAETNPNKSAVLYVSNFEYFYFGENVSEYHQKAKAQLMREMERANDKGLNVLVLGAVNDQHLIGHITSSSSKFFNTLEIESPALNTSAREEILEHLVKKGKLKLAGATEAERKDLTRLISEITEYGSMIELTNLVQKAKTVASERKHSSVEKTDFVEAYLRLNTGRASMTKIPEYTKDIVTSHECGHATNLEVMRNLATKKNIPWRRAEKVNFITLDPRGYYGGAVFHSSQLENRETTFEKVFSNIVCSYGGYSCEKKFFNIDGSYGITSDFEHVTTSSIQASALMGQGHNTGKISLATYGVPMTEQGKANVEKDVKVITNNACEVSDLITEAYADFNKLFTQKYSHLVGTGECLVMGDNFRQELNSWIESQPTDKKLELDQLDKKVLDIIDNTKLGRDVTVKKIFKMAKRVVR